MLDRPFKTSGRSDVNFQHFHWSKVCDTANQARSIISVSTFEVACPPNKIRNQLVFYLFWITHIKSTVTLPILRRRFDENSPFAQIWDFFVKKLPRGNVYVSLKMSRNRNSQRSRIFWGKGYGGNHYSRQNLQRNGDSDGRRASQKAVWNARRNRKIQNDKKRPRSHPGSLPIHNLKKSILDTISDHQVVVISGPTGCGKSTQV